KGEDTELEAAHGIFSPGGRVDTDFHRVAAPVAADVIGRDVGDNVIVLHIHVHEQSLAIVAETKERAAVSLVGDLALDEVGRRNEGGGNVFPSLAGPVEGWRGLKPTDPPAWHRVGAG